MKSLWVYPQKCTGCQECVLACSFQKTRKFSPRDACLYLLTWEEYGLTVPVVCAHCEDAPCEEVCPVEAISRDPTTEAMVVDRELCTSCGLCVEECPIAVIFLDRYEEKAMKCDLCQGQPACVDVCEPEALRFEEREWPERSRQQKEAMEARRAYREGEKAPSLAE